MNPASQALNRALAIAAHPDDIEFGMSGTLLLLRDRGWEIHCLTIANGDCGSLSENREDTAARRRHEAIEACRIAGATFHESITGDLGIYHTPEIVARVLAVVRRVDPRILLVHSPSDYMVDHEEACRTAVTAAFCRGIPNALCLPPEPPVTSKLTVYHAMPHGLRDALRQRVRAGQYVDVSSVLDRKRAMLAAHQSQQQWLDETQGMGSYLEAMEQMAASVGALSGRFTHAEGWRRHLHLGFSTVEEDPMTEALVPLCWVDPSYEAALDNP